MCKLSLHAYGSTHVPNANLEFAHGLNLLLTFVACYFTKTMVLSLVQRKYVSKDCCRASEHCLCKNCGVSVKLNASDGSQYCSKILILHRTKLINRASLVLFWFQCSSGKWHWTSCALTVMLQALSMMQNFLQF